MGKFEVKAFEDLNGKTITGIDGLKVGSEEVVFRCSDGSKTRLWYDHECCARCSVEDIAGDVNDLLESPVLLAEEATNRNENPEGMRPPEYQDSFTWTFYKLSTIKGSVTIRWYGESNGYYSESVTVDWAAV